MSRTPSLAGAEGHAAHKLAYSVTEACRALGCGQTLIYDLIRDGRLKKVKLGTRTLIPADSLKAFLASLSDAQLETSRAA